MSATVVNVQQAPAGDDPNAAAALARADQAHSPANPQAPGTPQLFAGKYKSVEELEKGYKELESKLGVQSKPADPVQSPAPTEAKPPVDTDKGTEGDTLAIQKEAEETLAAKGLDFAEFSKSYMENGGKLTDADFTKLEAAGIPKNIAEAYIAGQQALAEKSVAAGKALVGGDQVFDSMRTWAATNLTDADLEAYNESVSKGGAHADNALLALKARWQSATGGIEPSLVGGSQASGVTGYASLREMAKDQSDPRYASDPAFRRQVEARARVSKF